MKSAPAIKKKCQSLQPKKKSSPNFFPIPKKHVSFFQLKKHVSFFRKNPLTGERIESHTSVEWRPGSRSACWDQSPEGHAHNIDGPPGDANKNTPGICGKKWYPLYRS